MAVWQKIKNNENIYYALTNRKVQLGFSLFFLIFLLSIIGPMITRYSYTEFAGPGYHPPSSDYWFGTTIQGRDVFTRTVFGLRSTILVGFIGGVIASFIGVIIGLVAGYKGGLVDEILMMLTNVVLTFPTLAVLIIIAAYLPYRGIVNMAVLVGLTVWPWTARAVRSQAMSLKSSRFVDLSRISSNHILRILFEDIAANMFSYIFMVFILQFMGTILATVGLEFLGLGPTRGISLGLIMQNAVNWNALELGMWWWGIIPGLLLTIMIVSLYFINTGLDEAFNPKLREF